MCDKNTETSKLNERASNEHVKCIINTLMNKYLVQKLIKICFYSVESNF
jgi:hypothetical protein